MTSIGSKTVFAAVIAAAASAVAAGAWADAPKCPPDWTASPSSLTDAKSQGSYTCTAPKDIAVCSKGFDLQGSPVPAPGPLGGQTMTGPPIYKKDGRYIYVCIVPPPNPK